jgi:uncharacterized protein
VINQNPSDRNPGSLDPGALPYGWNAARTAAAERATVHEGFLTMSFVWMFLALLVSAATAGLTVLNQGALTLVADNFFILINAELGLVMGLSFAINRMSSTVAVAMLFVYAALNGATFSILFLAYALPSVLSAFVGASAIFGAAAVYGVATGRDLTSIGGLLFAGIIGIIVASVVNIFIGGSTLSFVIGIVGVLVFTGLTAYDVQRIRAGRMPWIRSTENASVVGALALYLDFVNLFLMLLRVFGGGSRS